MLLVCVFDGLRPDLVRPELLPRLCNLREQGTWFARSHCVFPSVTRVNAASLATGSYPSGHGIPSNTLFLPESNPAQPFQTTGDLAVLRTLRAEADLPLLDVPTTAEVLAEAGMSTVAVGTGSPGSAYLMNPEARRAGGATFHYDFCEPESLAALVEGRLGPHAGRARSETVENLGARIEHAAQALSEVIVPRLRPALAYFWCTVPDALHHRFGLGSPEACEGLRRVDAVFGRLLERLEHETGEPLNVIVTADHGYATIERTIDVEGTLRRAGVLGPSGAGAGGVTVDGGAGHLFFTGDRAEQSQKAVAFLLRQPWVAAVLSRHSAPGALPLTAVNAENRRAADVTFCFAWRPGENRYGYGGLSLGGGGLPVGAGDHGGGSPFELRNALIAAGPAFRAGVSPHAAGVVDIAPTLCRVLGLAPPRAWDGRVLDEALIGGTEPEPGTEATIRAEPDGEGRCSEAVIATTGGTRYVSYVGPPA